jgi:hypothetical protein
MPKSGGDRIPSKIQPSRSGMIAGRSHFFGD